MKNAVIIGNIYTEQIGGCKVICAPTISSPTLGNVEFEVARFFEEVD